MCLELSKYTNIYLIELNDMKKIIKLTESDLEKIVKRVLKEQSIINEIESDADDFGGSQETVNSEISNFNQTAPRSQKENMVAIQQKLKSLGYDLGTYGPNKDGIDGNYGKRTLAAIKSFQTKNGVKSTGWVGTVTAPLLGVSPMKGVSFVGKTSSSKPTQQTKTNTSTTKKPTQQTKTNTSTTKKPGISTDPKNRCIAISKEECAKISPTKNTKIGSGSETRCSAYMVKCLSQYDSELFGGNAWDAFNNVKGGGSVKYNLFTSGEVNWTKIWSDLAKNKVSKTICQKHASTDDADGKVNSVVPSIVTNSIPQSPKFSTSLLKLGDIVGLYHKNSSNKGMAFCQRALKRGLDNNGNVADKDPFTFNSHVGFVGAIKNGVPIVIHNVHGSHMATPATQMLSKNSEDMIAWVVSDNSIASTIESGVGTNPEKKEFGFSLPKFNYFS
jgi:peptidoglycan hydrolase-like protein with peptidoglycan-binding domain